MEKLPQKSLISQLPDGFETFLNRFQIDQKFYEDVSQIKNTPRYVRLKPDIDYITLDQLKTDLNCQEVNQVHGIKNLFMLPADVKIINSKLYKQGILYGIDYSSCCVVMALDIQKQDNVVDICCAPGAKLSMIMDLLTQGQNKSGSLCGIDISESRLNICKSILKKYHHFDDTRLTLICKDGRTFGENNFYDKVLVDAECTQDGSTKHLMKFVQKNEKKQKVQKNIKVSNKELKRRQKQLEDNIKQKKIKLNNWDQTDFQERFLDPNKLDNILELQFKLIQNGFRILKQNGFMVYSTCSLSQLQNEDLVIKFVNHINSDNNSIYKAQLTEPFSQDLNESLKCENGSIVGSKRFNHIQTKSGGMFLCKIQKLSKN